MNLGRSGGSGSNKGGGNGMTRLSGQEGLVGRVASMHQGSFSVTSREESIGKTMLAIQMTLNRSGDGVVARSGELPFPTKTRGDQAAPLITGALFPPQKNATTAGESLTNRPLAVLKMGDRPSWSQAPAEDETARPGGLLRLHPTESTQARAKAEEDEGPPHGLSLKVRVSERNGGRTSGLIEDDKCVSAPPCTWHEGRGESETCCVRVAGAGASSRRTSWAAAP